MKSQFFLFIVYLYQTAYNYLPFFVFKNLFLRLLGNQIGKCSYIHTKVKFFTVGKIFIGNNTTINPNCYLDAREGIKIGNNVNISHSVKIYTIGHDVDDPFFSGKGGKVVIEDNVVIFPFSIIMPRLVIEEGAVIYPGSVVTKNVGKYQIVGGNPAKLIRHRKSLIKYKLNYSNWFAL